MAPKFHALTLKSVDQITADSAQLVFDVPQSLKANFSFTPGQYLTLRATVDGQDIRRSYSICSAVGGDLAVGIKRIEGGAFSTFALALKPGDRVQVMTPQGRFGAKLGGTHNYLLLAAGSGVTPLLSIAKSVLDSEPNSTVSLCYANKSTDAVMFRQDLDDLKDQYLTRFLLTHLMTREAQDVALFNGRLDAEKLDTMATRGLISPTLYDAVFICGPQDMTEDLSQAMQALGVDPARIHFELFTPSTPLKQLQTTSDTPTTGARVEVILDGAQRGFYMQDGDHLVDAAAAAGLELPYSCANGMCATCRCKLAQGDATMRQNFSLEPWELEKGYVLACQVQPKSDKVVLDFDSV